MTTETEFPTDCIPYFDARGFRTKIDNFVARTRMDTGEFRQRQRYSRQLETTDVGLTLTDQEYDTWRGFVVYKLSQGVLPFLLDVPIGNGFVQREVNIVGGKWSARYIDHFFWRVRFKIEFLGSTSLTNDLISVYFDLDNDSNCSFDLVAFEAAVALMDNYTRNILPVHALSPNS